MTILWPATLRRMLTPLCSATGYCLFLLLHSLQAWSLFFVHLLTSPLLPASQLSLLLCIFCCHLSGFQSPNKIDSCPNSKLLEDGTTDLVQVTVAGRGFLRLYKHSCQELNPCHNFRWRHLRDVCKGLPLKGVWTHLQLVSFHPCDYGFPG